MKNEKIITHLVMDIHPDSIHGVLSEAKVTREKILLEDGCEVFNLTTKKDKQTTVVIFAIYTSQQNYEWHLEQDYVKNFFKFLVGKLLDPPLVTYLEEI